MAGTVYDYASEEYYGLSSGLGGLTSPALALPLNTAVAESVSSAGIGIGAGVGDVIPEAATLTNEQLFQQGVAAWQQSGGGATGIAAVAPVILEAVGANVPALATVAGLGLAAYGIYEGVTGGGNGQTSVGGVTLGGPGLAEPPANMVIKEWHVNYSGFKLQYYLVQMPSGGRKILMYNSRTGKWKAWPWRKPMLAVIGKNMPKHRQIVHLRKLLMRHKADAKTILKLTEPTALRQKRRRR